jgi:hypothetical protein
MDKKTGKCYGYIKAFENSWEYAYWDELKDNGYYIDGDFKPVRFDEYFNL